MGNKQRIAAMRRALIDANKKRSDVLVPLLRSDWPTGHNPEPVMVYISCKFLVQIYSEPDDVLRVSCNRTTMDASGGWESNLSWDELMEIKRQIGFGERYAVEVLPEDSHVVNVANLRHFWILPQSIIGWRRSV